MRGTYQLDNWLKAMIHQIISIHGSQKSTVERVSEVQRRENGLGMEGEGVRGRGFAGSLDWKSEDKAF